MPGRAPSIWWFAAGYFACYVPYSAGTKALSKGLIPGLDGPVSGFVLLPATVIASLVGMLAFLGVTGWWRHATRHRVGPWSIPGPTRLTALSGLGTAAIIGTTTLAYTFSGVSIVFMMLLMRGGVLILAPVVDALGGRRRQWFSWVALGLSLAALVVAFAEDGGFALSLIAVVDVAVYLGSYLLRLRLMTAKAKSTDPSANLRYFVEEQLVAAPAVLVLLGGVALLGGGDVAAELRRGFTDFLWGAGGGFALAIGLLSQGTGICGGLILLDKRENTFCVPVNRSSSILAGVVAAGLLTLTLGHPAPSAHQLAGAGLILVAIAFLSLPPLLAGRRGTGRAQPKNTPSPE